VVGTVLSARATVGGGTNRERQKKVLRHGDGWWSWVQSMAVSGRQIKSRASVSVDTQDRVFDVACITKCSLVNEMRERETGVKRAYAIWG